MVFQFFLVYLLLEAVHRVKGTANFLLSQGYVQLEMHANTNCPGKQMHACKWENDLLLGSDCPLTETVVW